MNLPNASSTYTACLCFLFLLRPAVGEERIQTSVLQQPNGEICLMHKVNLNAPVKAVWAAYSTSEGWRSWVAPVASVDMQAGGIIRCNYRSDANLDDADTIRMHVINYVPERLLTLQAEVSDNFPEVLKEREEQMFNVITFRAVGDNNTELISYGVGYKDSPELKRMLKFFETANEQSYESLIRYVEQGEVNPHTTQ